MFGLPTKGAEKPLDCGDGTDFGCARATDPLADARAVRARRRGCPRSICSRCRSPTATHDAVAGYALGASRDEAGPTFAGANGLENRWTIDGAPADSVRTGGADTKVPLTFLDGILVTAGGFAARDRTSTGGTIDAQLRRGTADHELEVHVWAGLTAAARHADHARDSYQVRNGTLDAGPDVVGVDRRDRSARRAPRRHDLVRGRHRTGSLARDDFNFYRRAPRPTRTTTAPPTARPACVDTDPIETNQITPINYSVPMMARAGLDRGPHHVDLTLIGSVADATRYIVQLDAAGRRRRRDERRSATRIATYRGEWKDTRARLQLAWHHSSHTESARDPNAAGIPQQLTAYVPAALADDPVLVGCSATTARTSDPYPMITNCPVPIGWFTSGGAGLLAEPRPRSRHRSPPISRTASAINVVRIGATGEDAR